jgi:hypothetical protein
MTGCGKKAEQGLVLVTPSVTAPPILRSEADQIAIPVRVDAPIRFENRSSVNQSLGISKTGCSCYGLATAESRWNPGELIDVPPGGHTEVFFVARELKGEAQQAFRAEFHVGPPVGSSRPSPNQEPRADCSMKVFADLVLDPESIVIDLPVDVGPSPPGDSRSVLTITRVTRGQPSPSDPPAFSMSPALLEAEPASQEKPAEEVSPGLWRTIWKTSLRPKEIPSEIREKGGRFSFEFEFPETNVDSTETQQPIRERQLPTILDVVRRRPQRKVTGQLILRRSKGIIVPTQLHFGVVPAGSPPRTRRLVLSAADHRAFQVTASDVPQSFKVDADSDEPAGQQWVTVTFEPAAAGDVEGKLTLKTTHPDQPEVQITLKARVQ